MKSYELKKLMERTAEKITANEDEWKRFLQTASRFIKYSFDAQLLIYAQKPEAMACASDEVWKRLRCWVRNGTKGIGLIFRGEKVTFVFDIKDVCHRKNGKYPYMWELAPEEREQAGHMLQEIYGIEGGDISDHLKEIVGKDPQGDRGDILIRNSMLYMLFYRCGLPVEKLKLEFNGIEEYSPMQNLCGLGNQITENVQPIMNHMSRIVTEIYFPKRVEKKSKTEYNKFNELTYKSEGGEGNDRNKIQAGGGLSSARSGDNGLPGGTAEQIWKDEGGVSRGEREGEIHGNAPDSRTVPAFDRDTESSKGEVRDNRGSHERKRGDHREDEGHGLDEVHYGDEQYPAYSGGDRADGDHLRLTLTDKDMREEAADNQSAAFPLEPLSLTANKVNAVEPKRVVTAIESTEDWSDPSIGFYTYHYPDGRTGTRYRLVIIGEDGNLAASPKRIFINRESVDEYIREHASEINVIPYDDLVYRTLVKKNKLKMERSVSPDEGKAPSIGGAKGRFRTNMDAIRALHTLEKESRLATPEERELLSGYVGWGGMPMAFDKENVSWGKEYQELLQTLSPGEYLAARESVLTAFYTPTAVIKAMYRVFENVGFRKGRILEPSCAVGSIIGMLPSAMKESKFFGVELEPISGRIAKQLYPEADIQIGGYEDTEFADDFFDAAIGNVPFGQYKINDKRYDKQNWLIHDYFFGATLDKVRPGGIIAFITSKGTLDKANGKVRKYIAQRAEFLGAIRLPNTVFKGSAGTTVTSDIIFLQKREQTLDIEPEWVHLGIDAKGLRINQYYIDHPEMILGRMEEISGPYGKETACVPTGTPLEESLEEAVGKIKGSYRKAAIRNDIKAEKTESAPDTLPATLNTKKYSYTIVGGNVYYRENSQMSRIMVDGEQLERMKGMVRIRGCIQDVLNCQVEDGSDEELKRCQEELNVTYDNFVKSYGHINDKKNKAAFSDDVTFPLLSSLESLDEEGEVIGKASVFSKRTIKGRQKIESVDTAVEALTVSINEKGRVDLDYMAALSGKKNKELIQELSGLIFKNPMTEGWETAEEYLSGYVRDKLKIAEDFAKSDEQFRINVEYLKNVQPEDVPASDIKVGLGANWIPEEYMNKFMVEILKTPRMNVRSKIQEVKYSEISGQWNVSGKSADRGNPVCETTYGTGRANAYKLLEDALNLREAKIYDLVDDKRILNQKETEAAIQKQEALKEAFADWIFANPGRRSDLSKIYNEKFNCLREREFDGTHLKFPGMNLEIRLKRPQKNGAARILYGKNTLLAYVVGGGKTYTMIAGAMESKRLGLCRKPMFVVPNHLTEQWAKDFMELYPGANILAATKKDFTPQNRKRFCARIATGDYDAVILGHTQFEKIQLSKERQIASIEEQISEIQREVERLKWNQGERYTIKEMERTRKMLEVRLKKLNDSSNKDDVVTFEELGVDRLFLDESHYYKNLFLFTKMRNVAGIATSEAKKSSDLFAKCRYIDEITGGTGITFATGTPISNSMTELYVNMRYLQYDTLQRQGLLHFDSWAATFGETTTSMELAPEGTGYRIKTRFAKFNNLPELMTMFKECADIQTADMLKLPVPEAIYENIVLKPSPHQQEMIKSLAKRADIVRSRGIDPSVDNMLKITNDGRKLALDQRLIDANLPEGEESKGEACADNVYKIWGNTMEEKGTQLLFCDLSTPKGKEKPSHFRNIYEEIRKKLIQKGIPEDEIAFIHDADTEAKKESLFAKVRRGDIRILIGSTVKMGAGTNVQDRIVAEHHLDVPWRPSDIEQREGRGIRQGNQNKSVAIYRYVTEGTFDSYSWQLIENKQKFVSQIMTSKVPVRSCEDLDDATLNYAEVKALATGNPYIKEKMTLDMEVAKLKRIKGSFLNQKYKLEDDIITRFPREIADIREWIKAGELDIAHYRLKKADMEENFLIQIEGKQFQDKKEAGTAILQSISKMEKPATKKIGEFYGFKLVATKDFSSDILLDIHGAISHHIKVGKDPLGNIARIGNVLDGMEASKEALVSRLEITKERLTNAKREVQRPFPKEAEMKKKMERLTELNQMLEGGRDRTQEQDERKISRENVRDNLSP